MDDETPLTTTTDGTEEKKEDNLLLPAPADGMYNLITFGKFENRYLKDMLRDRKYCSWLKDQDWFRTNFEYLYNSINRHNPQDYFYRKEQEKTGDFILDYKYFNLLSVECVVANGLALDEKEKKCYTFYLDMIQNLKNRIEIRKLSDEKNNNPYF